MLRNLSYRLGRKLYCWGRLESLNRPERNGEYALLRRILQLSDGPMTLLDVGANRGEWSRTAVSIARSNKQSLVVHAFEPHSGTRAMLEGSVVDMPEISVESVALSSVAGTAKFYSQSAGAGTNSLHPVSGSKVESVQQTTLDDWMAEKKFQKVHMIKIDVEGFDSLVLEGAVHAIDLGSVDVIQFEYNWRWLLNARSLLWVFDFIKERPYTLGKITPKGVLTFERWHFELDRFFEGNYVLLHKKSRIVELGRPAEINHSNALRVLK